MRTDRRIDRGSDRRIDRGSDGRIDRVSDRRIDKGSDRRIDRGSDRRIDRGSGRRTDMIKLIVVFRNFATPPKNVSNNSYGENRSTQFGFKKFLTTFLPCMR